MRSKLPDSAQLDSYKKRIKAVTTGKIKSIEDFNQRKAELKKIKTELKNDKEAIKLAKEVIKQSSRSLKEKLKALKSAPKEDFERLRAKYDISAGGASNFAALLFGDQAGEWSRQAFYWYEKIKPYIESDEDKAAENTEPKRLEGRFVHFKTDDPIPDFLIRKVAIGVVLPIGRVDAALVDITHQQEIINRPTRLRVNGEKLDGVDKLKMMGTFNHIQAGKGKDELAYSLTGVSVNNVKLIQSKKMPITLEQARAKVEGRLVYEKGVLTATLNSLFNDAKFSSGSTRGFGKALGDALQGINTFGLQGEAKGNLHELDISLHSDLDTKIKDALKGQFAARKRELELKLKNRLNEEARQYLAKYTDKLDGFSNSADIDTKQQEVENLLSAKVDDYKAQLERERKAKEEKIRQDVERKKEEARKKVEAEKAEAKRVLDEKKAKQKRALEEKLKAKFKF